VLLGLYNKKYNELSAQIKNMFIWTSFLKGQLHVFILRNIQMQFTHPMYAESLLQLGGAIYFALPFELSMPP